jgi:putative endonuclease
MHFVYILYSESLDQFYIGQSAEPETRLIKHLARHKGFTGKAKDWVICYKESYNSKKEAVIREKQLKSWKSKARITELIKRNC